MTDSIRLRRATMDDAKFLLELRNDPETRNSSHNTSESSMSDHLNWLSSSLNNNNRKLFVAEEQSSPVGTVRADCSEGVWELSWTTAPAARGNKVAKRMVSILANMIREPIRAEVKVDNFISAKVAESAGMTFSHKCNGIAHYTRSRLDI